MARSHWPECHSVCFPNMKVVWFFETARMSLRIGFLQHITECFPFAFRLLSECFQNTENGTRIYRTLSARFLNKCTNSSSSIYRIFADFTGILEWFGKGSSCFMSIRCVRKANLAFWKYTRNSENVLKEYWKGSGYSVFVRRHQWKRNPERILKTFGKHSSCYMTIPDVRKA